VFIWDRDVAACIAIGVREGKTGIYNLAGDGVMTLREIAARLGKRYIALPPAVVSGGLALLSRLGVSRYGPEQVRFLQYRPVLDNQALKREFGYTPRRTTREVFELYAEGTA
jgi:UDP-glucose 4-epimerase